MVCGLLGRKLGHSYSPQIHAHLGDYEYRLFETEPDQLEAFLRSETFTGINVTIPYKKDAARLCDSLSPIAKRLGAVNTVIKKTDGSLVGHNTDYFGFSSMIEKSGLSVTGKKVLILGSGGASVTAIAVLRDLGAYPVVISRSGENHYQNLEKHADAAVIVNATPVGMYPNTEDQPIDLNIFPGLEGVLDLIYNPARTKLLQQARQRKIVACNGLWMLVAQAKESAQWFTGKTLPNRLIQNIYSRLALAMENIVLVGMPGSGKSTIGKLLAQALHRPFEDSDVLIEQLAGKTIPEIFLEAGESGFRKLETEALSDICKRSGYVIATGGGCVTREENYPLLHQNSRIVWLKRDIDSLPADGRPLSQQTKMADMYAVRQPLYARFSDLQVENDLAPEQVVARIIQIISEVSSHENSCY